MSTYYYQLPEPITEIYVSAGRESSGAHIYVKGVYAGSLMTDNDSMFDLLYALRAGRTAAAQVTATADGPRLRVFRYDGDPNRPCLVSEYGEITSLRRLRGTYPLATS